MHLLLKSTIFLSATHRASDIIKNVRKIFETLDTRLLDALCDVITEGNMMSGRSTRNGSGEKIPWSIVIKLSVKFRYVVYHFEARDLEN